MLFALWLSRSIAQIRTVMVVGSSALLISAIALTVGYLQARAGGDTSEMLFRADTVWYAPLHIAYSVGVDGISVAMLLLSAVIVFTGTFASWRLQPLTKEYFLWFTLLSMGVFGFFISIDLFTMFMFYEIALIPMYLLIGVWGSGRKEYAAMKLTLMLMGGSAFLLIGILGIFFGSGGTTMNILEIAQLHNIPFSQQCIWFPLTFLGFGTMNGKDGKPFKTREGGVMRLENLIREIDDEMYKKIMDNRTVEEADARKTAAEVGLAAIKYGDLSNQASKDYIFDVDRFTSFEGNTGPYILYTIVRIKSILNRYKEEGGNLEAGEILPAVNTSQKNLMLELARFNEVMTNAAEELAPHKICAYIYDLANAFNKFYHETKILATDDMEAQSSWISLLLLTRRVLETCIDMLGFEAPERM